MKKQANRVWASVRSILSWNFSSFIRIIAFKQIPFFSLWFNSHVRVFNAWGTEFYSSCRFSFSLWSILFSSLGLQSNPTIKQTKVLIFLFLQWCTEKKIGMKSFLVQCMEHFYEFFLFRYLSRYFLLFCSTWTWKAALFHTERHRWIW